jgi:hypothetical protein
MAAADPASGEAPVDERFAEVVRQLAERFGDAVSITGNLKRGELTFHYRSSDELDDLLSFLIR